MAPILWVFSELFYPEQTSTGYLLTESAAGLGREFDTRVITGPASEFLCPVKRAGREVFRGLRIYRCAGTSFSKDRLMGRLANIVTRSLAMLWRGLRSCRRDDAVLVVTNPPTLPFMALIVRWLRGTPYVLLIHDVYPDVLACGGLLDPRSLLFRVLGALNRRVYERARAIVCLGRDMAELTHSRLGSGRGKVVVIPNWADLELIEPRAKKGNVLLRDLGWEEAFVVLYAGNIGRTHDVETVARAAAMLRERGDVKFLFVGFGARKVWLEDYCGREKLSHVRILSAMNRERQPEFLTGCDVGLIALRRGMAGVSVPSRLYNQMAAGRPIIAVADAASEVSQVVAEEEIGRASCRERV